MTPPSSLKKETRESLIIENEGEKIFSILHRPIGVINPPLVIVLHGFASNKLGTQRSYVHLATALSAGGIATLRYDARGCGDSEGALSEMTPDKFRSDLIAIYEDLQKQGFSKVGLFGSSFGGAIAVLGAAKVKIDSLVLWAPVASGQLWTLDFLAQHPESSPNPGSFQIYRGVKIHPQFQAQFAQMRADQEMSHLGDIPLLHFQGEKDEILSLAHQLAFKESRKNASAATRFVTYPEATHQLGHSKVFPEVVQESVRWFQSTMRG